MARILQFNFEDKLGQYLPVITGKSIVEAARKIHADTLVIFARDAWGRSYYNSRIARRVQKLGNRDLLREVTSEARKYGIKVYVMIGHTANPELYSAHPDWAQRSISGEVITMDTDPLNLNRKPMRWPLMCLNSPFLDHVLEEAREALSYDIDGVFLDSFRYMPDIERACFCSYCREKFKAEKKIDLPTKEEWDSLFYRESILWRYMVNVKAIKAIHNFIKSRNPKLPLIYNSHPAGWKGRANRIVELARDSIDIIFAECSESDYQPPGFISEMVKLSLATSNGKEVWASRNSFHTCLTTTSTTPIAIRQGIREAFIAGGSPLYLVFSSAFIQDKRVLDFVAPVYEEIEKLEEYMEGVERLRYAGVVYSNRTRDWAGRSKPEHVTDCFRGFYYALSWAGLPVDYIADWQLDTGKLEDYSVIVLANTQSMSKEAASNIARLKGKGVVATYLTSLMDEMGNVLEDFQLSDLFDVEFNGVVNLPWSYVYVEKDHAVTRNLDNQLILWGDFNREFTDGRTSPSIGWHARVKAGDKVKVLGWIGEPTTEFGFEYENGRSPPLLGSVTRNPAVVVNEEAKVAYFTGQLGRLYWRLGLPDYENLIVSSVLWAGGEPPVRLEADGLVQLEAYTRNGQVIVHLLNLTFDRRLILRGNMGLQKGWSGTVETVMPPRKIVPLRDLKLVFSEKNEPVNAYSPLTDKKFEIRRKNNKKVVGIDYLEEYEIVVLDL